MAKQLTDDELDLRRKARRRLIGAIALTLAVVVILPMVLDSEPKPTAQDIDLHIPAPDKIGEFVPGVVVPRTSETPLADSAVEAAPASVPAAVSAVAQADTVKPVVAPNKEPTAASDAKVVAPGKTQAASNKPQEAKAAATADSYVAQIGAYSNADTAKQELDKLKKWGFKAYTEKVDGKVRVRVGPYAEREKVEKVRQLLEKHGLHPTVTNVK